MTNSLTHVLVVCSIVVVSAITYFPAVDNSFISDDFGIFPLLDALDRNPSYIFEATSELFRVTSYAYFWVCMQLFGVSAEAYYATGIILHALVSVLVYFLVLRVTNRRLAAWPAAIFFAAYERHQEAVMWISAVNEVILTIFCLLFLLLWQRAISKPLPSRLHAGAAFVVLTLALFSKEAAVALAPLAVGMLLFEGYSLREVLERSIPVVSLVAAFSFLWLSQADRNFFVTDGHYAFGFHSLPVFGRAVLRLLSPAIPLMAVWLALRRREAKVSWRTSFLFFSVLLVIAIVPYCFLTYLDHLPSRHTYFPSVGLAGLVGILFAGVYDGLASVPARRLCVAALLLAVTANAGYIWFKKEPQYRERAAPTRQLIDLLQAEGSRLTSSGPIFVCGFPLGHPWWFEDAVSRFTSVSAEKVVLLSECTYPADATVLVWDDKLARYDATSAKSATLTSGKTEN